MIYLIRNSLKPFITQVDKDSHAGLLMQRGLQVWQGKETTNQKDKSDKQDLIGSICKTMPSELYLLAFNRWLNATYDKTNFATLSATIDGRLFTGLPLGGTLETGAMTHHSYGMPMIAGSSVKGAVRSYAEHLFAERDSDGRICYQDKKVVVQANKQALLDVLFGTDSDDENADAGYLIWHDAWWIPQITSDGKLATGKDKNQPFVGEIVTVHHQKYYNGDLPEALDIENPIPNQQIAIQGSFYFVIEGESRWAKFAQMLLQDMLVKQGVGAKGSNGYGYFNIGSDNIKPYLQAFEQQKEQVERILKAEALKQATVNLNDNQKLIYTFSQKLNDLGEQWKKNVNQAYSIEIDGKPYWFNTLFTLVKSWNRDDQVYAINELFTKYQKHLSKKMQTNVKELKKELGI